MLPDFYLPVSGISLGLSGGVATFYLREAYREASQNDLQGQKSYQLQKIKE